MRYIASWENLKFEKLFWPLRPSSVVRWGSSLGESSCHTDRLGCPTVQVLSSLRTTSEISIPWWRRNIFGILCTNVTNLNRLSGSLWNFFGTIIIFDENHKHPSNASAGLNASQCSVACMGARNHPCHSIPYLNIHKSTLIFPSSDGDTHELAAINGNRKFALKCEWTSAGL